MTKEDLKFEHSRNWRRAHTNQAQRERLRLIKLGTIIPQYMMPPTAIYKDSEGNWKRGYGND